MAENEESIKDEKQFSPEKEGETVSEKNEEIKVKEEDHSEKHVHDVYIDRVILEEIEQHCRDNTYEIIGLLVGNAFRFNSKEYVIITGYLYSEMIESTPVFTQVIDGAIGEMARKKDEQFPGSIIVGWWHSHPNLGVFLSSVDIATMEMYDKPFHVALVVDPIREERAFFKIDDEKHYHYVSYAVLK